MIIGDVMQPSVYLLVLIDRQACTCHWELHNEHHQKDEHVLSKVKDVHTYKTRQMNWIVLSEQNQIQLSLTLWKTQKQVYKFGV